MFAGNKARNDASIELDTTPIDNELVLPQKDEEEYIQHVNEHGMLVPLSQRDLRSVAFHILYAAEQFDYTASVGSIVDNLRRGFDIEIADDSSAIVMATEVIAMREELDRELVPLLKNWRLDRLGLCTRLICRLALWELLKTDTPASIVINEAVELAKAFAEKDAYKFINGVLDECARRLGKSPLPSQESINE